jgi:hypothetical protein
LSVARTSSLGQTDRVLIVAADRDGTPRRLLRDVRVPARYRQRYLMPDGSVQAVTVHAWNKDEAATLAMRELRERIGDDPARAAWPYGVERAR